MCRTSAPDQVNQFSIFEIVESELRFRALFEHYCLLPVAECLITINYFTLTAFSPQKREPPRDSNQIRKLWESSGWPGAKYN